MSRYVGLPLFRNRQSRSEYEVELEGLLAKVREIKRAVTANYFVAFPLCRVTLVLPDVRFGDQSVIWESVKAHFLGWHYDDIAAKPHLFFFCTVTGKEVAAHSQAHII